MGLDVNFWKGKRVLLTGHTGFKGAWMSLVLETMGAEIVGVSLPPLTDPNLYETLAPWKNLKSIFCDIRDRKKLEDIIQITDPEIVIHMAAQPLVRESYHKPIETLETNVMGTAYLLEALRVAPSIAAILVVTSDKVYANYNADIPMTEASSLGGHDPYSASKAATEIVTSAYAKSFFENRNVPVFTARAGNVIGGGDWAEDRIIPDLWRAYSKNETIKLRYPEAVRPWQHVLDPLYGYLLYVQSMLAAPNHIPRALNFGPPSEKIYTVLDLAKYFAYSLESQPFWTIEASSGHLQESKFLSIDSSLAKHYLGWGSRLDVDKTIVWTCEWYKAFRDGKNIRKISLQQISSYFLTFNIEGMTSHVA